MAIRLAFLAAIMVACMGAVPLDMQWEDWVTELRGLLDPAGLAALNHDTVERYFAPVFSVMADPASPCKDEFRDTRAPPYVSDVTVALLLPKGPRPMRLTDKDCAMVRFGRIEARLHVAMGAKPSFLTRNLTSALGPGWREPGEPRDIMFWALEGGLVSLEADPNRTDLTLIVEMNQGE